MSGYKPKGRTYTVHSIKEFYGGFAYPARDASEMEELINVEISRDGYPITRMGCTTYNANVLNSDQIVGMRRCSLNSINDVLIVAKSGTNWYYTAGPYQIAQPYTFGGSQGQFTAFTVPQAPGLNVVRFEEAVLTTAASPTTTVNPLLAFNRNATGSGTTGTGYVTQNTTDLSSTYNCQTFITGCYYTGSTTQPSLMAWHGCAYQTPNNPGGIGNTPMLSTNALSYGYPDIFGSTTGKAMGIVYTVPTATSGRSHMPGDAYIMGGNFTSNPGSGAFISYSLPFPPDVVICQPCNPVAPPTDVQQGIHVRIFADQTLNLFADTTGTFSAPSINYIAIGNGKGNGSFAGGKYIAPSSGPLKIPHGLSSTPTAFFIQPNQTVVSLPYYPLAPDSTYLNFVGVSGVQYNWVAVVGGGTYVQY